MKTNKEAAQRIADATVDAYSRDRYTDAGWAKIIKNLLLQGFNEAEARWVLESKHMCWAADRATGNRILGQNHNFNAYVMGHCGSFANLLAEARRSMIPTGADLAGSCEGEQIAQALDLLRVAANGGSIQNSAKLFLAEIAKRAGR